MTASAYLEMFARARSTPTGWKYSSVEALVLAVGVRMNAGPPQPKYGAAKACYRNAYDLCDRDPKRFVYVEGYAVPGAIQIPLAHAWCIDRRTGFVCDPTWRDGTAYFGVALALPYVRRVIVRRRRFGVLDNPEMGFPALRDGLPAEAMVKL